MQIGFTGTQKGMTTAQGLSLLIFLRKKKPSKWAGVDWFHHGDCIGADSEAHEIAVELGFKVAIHPPSSSSKRALRRGDHMFMRLPYLQRNRAIVDATEMLVATPRQSKEIRRSGTWATIRWALKKGRPVVIIFPDGSVDRR